MTEGLAKEVRRFIDAHITSVEQIEALLLLRSDPTKEWSAEEVAKTLYTSEESVATRLDDLYSHGLLSQVRSDAIRYRFEQRNDSLRAGVEDLIESYAKRKVAVINQIFAGPSDDVQSLADAFRFRKERD